jgi:hypothetical protein
MLPDRYKYRSLLGGSSTSADDDDDDGDDLDLSMSPPLSEWQGRSTYVPVLLKSTGLIKGKRVLSRPHILPSRLQTPTSTPGTNFQSLLTKMV